MGPPPLEIFKTKWTVCFLGLVGGTPNWRQEGPDGLLRDLSLTYTREGAALLLLCMSFPVFPYAAGGWSP